jgi:hypothetical protein
MDERLIAVTYCKKTVDGAQIQGAGSGLKPFAGLRLPTRRDLR